MSDLIERSAALRVIFDSVGRPATEIYQKVRGQYLPYESDTAIVEEFVNACCK